MTIDSAQRTAPGMGKTGFDPAEVWLVDSFASSRFTGNPAAVVLFEQTPSDGLVAALGSELGMPATAVMWPHPSSARAAGANGDAHYCLRWRTAIAELPLCGHGTLAAAHLLYTSRRVAVDQAVRFETAGGPLTVHNENDWLVMDFPAFPARPVLQGYDELASVVGKRASPAVRSVHRTDLDLIVELADQDSVIAARPDLDHLLSIDVRGLILTSKSAQSADHDFVSRFFSPATGLIEDAVTGSTHCALAPFWFERLGGSSLLGYQASKRGGFVRVSLRGSDRVTVSGTAVTVFRGLLALD